MSKRCGLAWVVLVFASACLSPVPGLEVDGVVDGKAKLGRCGPMNCQGCCDGDMCLGGNFDDACGYDGRACVGCPSTHVCDGPGACYSRPMAAAPYENQTPDPTARCYLVNGQMRCE